MKIVSLKASASDRHYSLDQLSPRLNVVCGSHSSRSELYHTMSSMLFGGDKSSPGHRTGVAQVVRFGSERVFDWRERTSSIREDALESPIAARLDAQIVAELDALRRCCSIDFTTNLEFESLLSALPTSPHLRAQSRCRSAQVSSPLNAGDAIDQLVQRRDELTTDIERHISDRRETSRETESELRRLNHEIATTADRISQARWRLRQIEANIARAEAVGKLRQIYDDLGSNGGIPDEVEQLDERINRLQSTLNELQHRSETVETELSESSTSDKSELQRLRSSTVVLDRLLTDLNKEMSSLADPNDSKECVCLEAYPRMEPLTELLRQEVYSVCALLSRQQRRERREWLKAEREQLEQCREQLSQQIDLWRTRRNMLDPRSLEGFEQTWSNRDEQCRCERHAEFQGMVDDRLDRQEQRADWLQQRQLQREEIDALQDTLHQMQRLRTELQRQRAGLSASVLAERQSEPIAVEGQLRELLSTDVEQDTQECCQQSPNVRSAWDEASDFLCQITAGELCRVELDSASVVSVTNSAGRKVSETELNRKQRECLYLTLCLAAITSHHRNGYELPLLLNEPLLGLEPPQQVAVVDVLYRFAQRGHQVVVFSDDGLVANDTRVVNQLSIVCGDIETSMTHSSSRTNSAEGISTDLADEIVQETQSDDADRGETQADSEDPFTADQFRLHLTSPIEELGFDDATVAEQLRYCGVRRIEELLDADTGDLARQLHRSDINTEHISHWQAKASLKTFVPHLSGRDAEFLAACGIEDSDQLAAAQTDELCASAEQFLQTERGRSYLHSGYRFDRSQIERWIGGARRNRNAGRTRRGARQHRLASRGRQESGGERFQSESADFRPSHSTRDSNDDKGLRFYLELSDPVVDAPSIGPKTADRIARCGVRTVGDLLNADARRLAERLEDSRINQESVSCWKQQARLMCRVPQIRGHDAQILVACEITQAEQLSRMDPQELLAIVDPFIATKEGERILRGGRKPDLAEVTDWINWAQSARILKAA